MFVVRRNETSAPVLSKLQAEDPLTSEEVGILLRHVVALPANPGQILCWDERLLHWGGLYQSGSQPRVSIALEFTTAVNQTRKAELRLIDPLQPPPPFEARLDAIATAILKYRRFEPMLEMFAPIAEGLRAR